MVVVLLVAAAGDVVGEDPARRRGRGRSRRTAGPRPGPAWPGRGCRGSSWRAGSPCRRARAARPRSSRSAPARPGTAGPARRRSPRCRRCRRAEYSSAGKTFSISRWAMRLPIVARRSPAMTTPPAKVSATIVVACGTSGTMPGRQRTAAGQQLRARARQELGERGGPRRRGRRAGSRPGVAGELEAVGHWPPFCTKPLTNSSALLSSTSSISSRIASTSSSFACA